MAGRTQHRGGSRARNNSNNNPDLFGGLGLTGYLRMLGGADPKTGKGGVDPKYQKPAEDTYRSRRQGLDYTYPERKPYRSRRAGLDSVYPDRKPISDPVDPPRNITPPDGGTETGFTPIEINLGLAEKSLGRKIADVNSFLSESLPVVGYRDQGGREIRPTGDDLSELQGSFADGLISSDQLIFEGISSPGKNGVSPADTADNKRSVRIPGDMDDMDPMSEATGGADDDDFAGPDPEDYATNYSARRRAQRNTFLDPSISNSMDALNASKAEIGLAVRGGKHYVNDNGTLREITKAAYDKHSSTGLSAEELKGAYVDSIKETLVPVATSGVFSEGMDLGPISEGVTLNSPVDMGDMSKTEFDFNNLTPGFSIPREQMKLDYFADVNYDVDDDED